MSIKGDLSQHCGKYYTYEKIMYIIKFKNKIQNKMKRHNTYIYYIYIYISTTCFNGKDLKIKITRLYIDISTVLMRKNGDDFTLLLQRHNFYAFQRKFGHRMGRIKRFLMPLNKYAIS